jgi:outer membrane protein TolC
MKHIVLSFCAAASLAGGAAAQAAPDTLRLSDALAAALAANPMLRATRFSAVAAAERVGPAGALPDPQLQFGLMNRMVSDFGSTMDPMTMNQVQLMQMLPWPGKLGNARRAARHTAGAAQADAEEQTRMLEAQVRMAYYEVAYVDRALDVMERTRGLLRDFLEVSTTMYAVGSAVQQDVLRAQVEVARMGEEITRMEQERLAMAARLNALLGRDRSCTHASPGAPGRGGAGGGGRGRARRRPPGAVPRSAGGGRVSEPPRFRQHGQPDGGHQLADLRQREAAAHATPDGGDA